ncbi:MAG: hypothetical protein ABI645_05255 [Pseudomonadota bacterium]
MKNAYVRIGLSALLLAAVAATSADAADKFKVPRTSWGDPAISGIFTNNTDVPVERAANLGEKAFFTEQEYAARKKAAQTPQQPVGNRPNTAVDVHYDNSEFGLEPEQNEMVKNLRTSIITQPANGRLPPLRPDAQKRGSEARARTMGHDMDSAQDRPVLERCIIWPHEGPPLRPVAYNTHVQITQTRDHVILMTEMIHDARVIPIAKSKPDFAGLTRWQGNSWGHWEGDTLVIETTGITDKVTPRGANVPMGPEGKVIEKLTRTGPKTVTYEFTVSDPSIWDTAWGGEFPMDLTDGPVFEYACHEGNYGMANTLRGAREEERQKAAGTSK